MRPLPGGIVWFCNDLLTSPRYMIGGDGQLIVNDLEVSVSAGPGGEGGSTVMRLAGESDMAAPGLRDALSAEVAKKPGLLLVEMSGLRFMDSSALGAVIAAYLELRRDGCVLALVSPTDMVARVLEVTGVGRMIPVYPSIADATAN